MTVLPIVDRELRVAARRRFSWLSRIFAAAIALGLFVSMHITYRGTTSLGAVEFDVLKWAAFVVALFAGAFLTADSLSEERRQGTLGLLFLTDLRGYDVVLGKLVSHSLLGFYGLLAVFPVLGLAFMAGGVTLAEFWQTLLVLSNTLFFSLTLGLWVSSLSLDSGKALICALFLCLFFSVGLMGLDWLLGLAAYGGDFSAMFSLASPAYLFGSVGSASFSDFWPGLGLQHAMAWVFLFLASWRTPRIWQERDGLKAAQRGFFQRWRFGNPRSRVAFRRAHLSHDPIAWMVLRDRWLPRIIWFFTFLAISPRVIVMLESYYFGSTLGPVAAVFLMVRYSETAVMFLLQLFIAILACRFLATSRNSGALELLLVTPLSARQIVRGQLTAMWRALAFPLTTISSVYILNFLISVLARRDEPASYPYYYMAFFALGSVVLPFADAAALALFGMWMGLTSQKSSVAVSKTLFYGWFLPLIAQWLLQMLFQLAFINLSLRSAGVIQLFNVSTFFVRLAKDAFFIIWSWNRLMTRFRDGATDDSSSASPWFKKLLPAVSPMRYEAQPHDQPS